MTRELTCIVCPRGCPLTVEMEGKTVSAVKGFACTRGQQYAINECTHPMRTVTSTVRTENGDVLPVKTDRPVPKELMMEIMGEINRVVAKLPVRCGDMILENVLCTGSSIVATANADL